MPEEPEKQNVSQGDGTRPRVSSWDAQATKVRCSGCESQYCLIIRHVDGESSICRLCRCPIEDVVTPWVFHCQPAGAQALPTHGWVVGKCRSQGSDSKTQSTRHPATFSAKPLDPPVTHDLGSRLLCLSFSAISATSSSHLKRDDLAR